MLYVPSKMSNYQSDFSTSSFTETSAYYKLLGFLEDINHDIVTKQPTKKNDRIHKILDEVSKFIDKTDLEEGQHRFANSGAIKVHEKIENMNLSDFLPSDYSKKNLEMLQIYFRGSFGNKIRLDYGTGHEIFFLSFLYIAKETSLLEECETKPLFQKYFQLIRKFIFKFNIEPAGSNGMFAIDDYSFLSFLFGSAELVDSKIEFDDLLSNPEYSNFLYAEALSFCVKHKCRLVERPFSKHSPIIYSLRTKSWSEINEKMMEEVVNKVLDRFVVMQHFVFCELLQK